MALLAHLEISRAGWPRGEPQPNLLSGSMLFGVEEFDVKAPDPDNSAERAMVTVIECRGDYCVVYNTVFLRPF